MRRPARPAPIAAALALLAACTAAPVPGPVTPVPTADPVSEPAQAIVETEAPLPAPPRADSRPYAVSAPSGERDDPYYWLRDDERRNADVLAYLEAENEYADAMLAPGKPLEDALYREMVARIEQDDTSVPYERDGYWYYTRFVEGQQYGVVARKKGSLDAAETIVLDENQRAEGQSFYKLADWAVSPDGTKLAFTEDTVGRRQYVLRFKDLTTGKVLDDEVANVESDIAWAADNRTVLYVEKDPTTLLGSTVRRHELGAEGADPIVYEEQDKSFYVGVGTTKSGEYLVISLRSTAATEYRLVPSKRPASKPRVFFPRETDHLYDFDHAGGRFVILSNWKAPNNRLFTATERTRGKRQRWREVIAHKDDAFIDDMAVFDDFVAVAERSGSAQRTRIVPLGRKGTPFYLEAEESAYTMSPVDLPESKTRTLRYTYTSLTTPKSVYEVALDSGDKKLLKREPVLGTFSPDDYESKALFAPARDGSRIPVSVVYRKGTALDGTAPLFVTGYGSYGMSYPVSFTSARLSLLDRGVVFAIAHIRGGQELGRAWYDQGRLLKKKNTFTDFVDATEFLVAEGYGDRNRVAASGGSAGGLLMGAVVNMRPDLYRAIVADVPFVDVVTTMLDESIPLTTNEFEEWGNPKQPEFYYYILSYSPYDNVVAADYPAMLVTTGLWDSQVQYFEPAKWVARLRARKTDSNPLLFVTNMDAGHGGKSGRFSKYRELARDWAFVLRMLDGDAN